MPKANADRKQEWFEFEISLGEAVGKLLDVNDPVGMGQRIGEVIEEQRGAIHQHLAERIDQALSDEVVRLVEGNSNKGLKQFDQRYFRLQLNLDAIVTSAGVDGRPMRRTESIEELFDRGRPQARVSAGAMGGGGTPTRGKPTSDQRSNTLNPNHPASRSAASNRSNQMNPNNPSHRTSRSGNR